MVNNIPIKKKHKGKTKENPYLLFQLPNGVLGGFCKEKENKKWLIMFL